MIFPLQKKGNRYLENFPIPLLILNSYSFLGRLFGYSTRPCIKGFPEISGWRYSTSYGCGVNIKANIEVKPFYQARTDCTSICKT